MQKSPTKSFKSPKLTQNPLNSFDLNHSERFISTRSTNSISQFQTDPKDLEKSFQTHSSLFSPTFLTPSRPPLIFPLRPYKVLDAPNLADDFYCSVLDWSCSNIISVGLGTSIYFFNKNTCKVTQLFGSEHYICSVKFNHDGNKLVAGLSKGEMVVFDVGKETVVRRIDEHKGRVGNCAWKQDVLTSGGLDGYLVHSDLRSPSLISKFRAHNEEICGLDWSSDYLATGSNDNSVKIWPDFSSHSIISLTGHTAAVKSLVWSPFERHSLLTGGGTVDKKIRVWETIYGKCLKEVDSGSQICSMVFSQENKELITGHGFYRNEIIVWKYPDICIKNTGSGHEDRVLYLSLSPDGQEVVSGGADSTLRFWKLFDNKKSETKENFLGELR